MFHFKGKIPHLYVEMCLITTKSSSGAVRVSKRDLCSRLLSTFGKCKYYTKKVLHSRHLPAQN